MSRNYVVLCISDSNEEYLRAFELPDNYENNSNNAMRYFSKNLDKKAKCYGIFSLKTWQNIKWINKDGKISSYSGFKAWDE